MVQIVIVNLLHGYLVQSNIPFNPRIFPGSLSAVYTVFPLNIIIGNVCVLNKGKRDIKLDLTLIYELIIFRRQPFLIDL